MQSSCSAAQALKIAIPRRPLYTEIPMDAYPLDLILAVATASVTIFLGFLPTKTISCAFFARETLKASAAWTVVAFFCPLEILHYPLILAIICLCAWWHFSGNHALNGKLWLNVASGLGISAGVMLILAVTPRAYPPGLPLLNQALLLAAIYLGGSVIGLAYVCFALIQGAKANSGVTQSLVQRYIGLLLYLTVVRAVVILAIFFVLPGHYVSKTTYPNTAESVAIPLTQFSIKGHLAYVTESSFSLTDTIAVGLAVLVLPLLAYHAQDQAGFSSRVQPTRFLIVIIFIGSLAEILARLLVL